ncbi:MAG: lipid-A-disaccharide synthase [Xanthobacteraceae bacterium]|nr:lipid-A-disaccharide synthase [Xanthobacteraceae bacterium]
MTVPAGAARSSEPLTVCIIAAEASGDHLGAALMRALKSRHHALRLIGVGRGEMANEGLQSLRPGEPLALIGFGVITHLPAILRYIRDVADRVVAARPDVLVIIDSPELTHRIAKRVRKASPSIPIVDYVSPSVWAWRPGRARAMRAYVDHVLALLPFEPQAHERLGGPPCSYVGHPLIEQLDRLRPNAGEAARRLADPPVVVALPGSRAGEIRRMTAVFGEAVALVRDRAGPIDVVVPTVPQLENSVQAATAGWTVRPRVVVSPAEKWAAFRTARAALAKSGTVTLELALAGVPTVAAYKVSLLDEMIARAAINVPSIILANLVIGENVVPELLQRDCTPRNLADALTPLLVDSAERRRQVEAFARLDSIMETGTAEPSGRAADIVLSYLTK